LGFILEIDIGQVLAVPVSDDERFLTFLDRPGRGKRRRSGMVLPILSLDSVFLDRPKPTYLSHVWSRPPIL
jgi:hypothetical protein